MRRLAVLIALGLMAAALPTGSAPVNAAATCFGLPATIADHNGKIVGTAGDDVIIGDDGDNDGRGGVDRICGGDGDDVIVAGGPGTDPTHVLRANGGKGNDTITGSYDDRLFGGAGDDVLWGLSGNDQLFGQDGADELHGGL